MIEIDPVIPGDIESELSECLRACCVLFPLETCSVRVVICRDDQLIVCRISIGRRSAVELSSQSDFSGLKILGINSSAISFDNLQNALSDKAEYNGVIFGSSVCDTILHPMDIGMIKAIWAGLGVDSYVLFLRKSRYFAIDSYLFFRKIKSVFSSGKCYIFIINPLAKSVRFISVKYRLQRNYTRNQAAFKKLVPKLTHVILSILGLYPWLERRHAVVARKC